MIFMKRVIEHCFCDCCGKEFDQTSLDYVSEDLYSKISIRLPYTCEDQYNTLTINDICDDCMKKLLNFTDELIPDILKE